ncbi:MAG: hypothetical protein GY913_20645 [Proteobacteria bacterium]|nr:hypothetical protein [Pseudomonadota bacterium]MCP4919317.1 hypothetical protein [Pseudomonadota bacterium]
MASVLVRPTSVLPGDPYGDVYKHAWSFWHTLACLFEGHPLETPFLNAPGGAVLLDVMLVPALVMSPVSLVAGPVFAANLWVVLSLFGIGLSTWLLTEHATGSRLGATVAGLCAQSAPYLYGYPLESGVHERLTVWIFPLMVLGVLKARDGSWRWGLAAVAAVAASTMGCQAYGLFAAILLVLGAPLWFRAPDGKRVHWKVLLPTLLGIGLALGLVYLLVRQAALHSWSASIQLRRTDLTFGGMPSLDVATLSNLFDPFAVSGDTQATAEGDRLLKIVYLGWVPLVAATVGAAVGRFRIKIIVALGLLSAVMAMGATIEGFPNPVHLLFARTVPAYGALPPIWQQVAAFGPLAAVGVGSLVARWPKWWLAGLIVVLCVAERALALPLPLLVGTTDARVSGIYEHVDGPIVEIPRLWGRGLAPGPIFLAQTEHEQPVPVAINVGSSAFEDLPEVAFGRADDWESTIRCLEGHGFAWLAYHPSWLERGVDSASELARIEAVVGPAEHADEGLLLFRLTPNARHDAPLPRPAGRYGMSPAGSCPGM